MNAVDFARQALDFVHSSFRGTITDLTDDQANHPVAGTAGSIASSMAHLVVAEDSIVHVLLAGAQTLAEGEFKDRTGINLPQWFNDEQWRSSVRVQVAPFKVYADAVFAATEAWVSSRTADDLERPLDLTEYGIGQVNEGWAIAALLVAHAGNLTGEVSALKGTQGLKGYPF